MIIQLVRLKQNYSD